MLRMITEGRGWKFGVQTEALRWADEANREEEDNLSGTQPAWGDWHGPVVLPLLLREAEDLVNNKQSGR